MTTPESILFWTYSNVSYVIACQTVLLEVTKDIFASYK